MPSSILLVDSIPTNRIALAALLEEMQHNVVAVPSLDEVDFGAALAPALVIIGASSMRPDAAVKSYRKRNGANFGAKPPVLCLVKEATAEERFAILKAGARDVLARPVPDALLLASVRRILREVETGRELERRSATASSFGFGEAASGFEHARRIATVGSGENARVLTNRLSAALGYDVMWLGPDDALRDREDGRSIDAYVVLPDQEKSGHIRDLLPELRTRAHSRHSAILVLYPEDAADIAADALNGGAADIASCTASGGELSFRLDAVLRQKIGEDALRRSAEESYRLAVTDALTGLYNRRYAEAYLADVVAQSRGTGRDVTLMMIDIDHFKRVNDEHGHAAGDDVLRAVADRIRDNLRAVDLVSRHGGEEFLVVLPETDRDDAVPAADRLRAEIGDRPIRLGDGSEISVTVSIGVSVCAPAKDATILRGALQDARRGPLPERIVRDADSALYRAKADGRNCVNFTLTAA